MVDRRPGLLAAMRIGVFGTGVVGQTIATRLVELGHDVVLGARDAANEKAAAWVAATGERAGHGTFADAAANGALLVNATAGLGTLAAVASADGADLEGKVLIDVSNALDHSAGFPPRLSTAPGDSIGEQLQRAHPTVHVVKSLNTMTAAVMMEPARAGEGHEVFVAGDHDGAKTEVSALLQEIGWPESHIRDVGGIEAARGLEAYVLFWVALRMALGTSEFNIAITKQS